MARGRRRASPPREPRNLTPYQRRVFRRIGLLPEEARQRGISLAAARGHRPRRLVEGGPIIREHQLRELRRAERGQLSESERYFLRKQERRIADEPKFEAAKAAFERAPPDLRHAIIATQSGLQRAAHTRAHFRAAQDWGGYDALEGDIEDFDSDLEPLLWYH